MSIKFPALILFTCLTAWTGFTQGAEAVEYPILNLNEEKNAPYTPWIITQKTSKGEEVSICWERNRKKECHTLLKKEICFVVQPPTDLRDLAMIRLQESGQTPAQCRDSVSKNHEHILVVRLAEKYYLLIKGDEL